jgi:hypothetical protein
MGRIDAEHLGDDDHGQRSRECVDQVEAIPPGHGPEEIIDHLANARR